MLRSLDVGDRIELLLYQAGLTMRAGVLVTLTATLAMIGYVFGVMAFKRPFPGVIFLVLFAAIPYAYVRYRKFVRMNAFRQAFPDALDLLVSCLKAGLSFTAAMQVVSEESPEPLRREFAITVEEQALGLDAREAMTNFARRVDVVELRFFITAVLLQRETGGNLAEVLSNAAALIRDRFRVIGDINTYTVQGKMTALILILLPIGVSVYLYLLTPDFFKPMLESEAGVRALWFAGGMQLVGCYVIYRIVNIKV
jgi:tight adherence protein B